MSQRRKKKASKAKLRNMCKPSEEEASVRNDPWPCNSSISMVRKHCVNINISKTLVSASSYGR